MKNIEYKNLKNNYLNTKKHKTTYFVNLVKTKILHINKLSEKEQKVEIINNLKKYILNNFGYNIDDIGEIFIDQKKYNLLSSKDLYKILILIQEMNEINNLYKSNINEFYKIINSFSSLYNEKDLEILSFILPFLQKNLENELYSNIFYLISNKTGTDIEDFTFKESEVTMANFYKQLDFNDEILKIRSKLDIPINFEPIFDDFISDIIKNYNNNDDKKGIDIFENGVTIFQEIISNKNLFNNFLIELEKFLQENGKNKIYLNGRDGLKLKIIIEKYFGNKINILRFEMSRSIIDGIIENKETEIKKYLHKIGLNENNIDDYIGIDTGSIGRIIRYINKIFNKNEKQNTFLWGLGENDVGFKHDYKIIERLPKEKQRAETLVKGNIIQNKNNQEIILLSHFSDEILKHLFD